MKSSVSRRNFLKTSAIVAASVSLEALTPTVTPAKELNQTVIGKAGITGIHHAGIYVQNMAEAVQYYESMFGFRLLTLCDTWEGPNKPLKLGFLRLGDNFIELLQPLDISNINTAAMNTQNHFCLRTSDAEKTYAHLKSKGANLETPIIDTTAPYDRKVTDETLFKKYGDKGAVLKIFFVRGLNGERIEVMQDNIGNIK